MQHKETWCQRKVNLLLDGNSFQEAGMLVSKSVEIGNIDKRIYGDGVVTGFGTINGKNVMVYSQDFTVCGSLGEGMQTRFVES